MKFKCSRCGYIIDENSEYWNRDSDSCPGCFRNFSQPPYEAPCLDMAELIEEEDSKSMKISVDEKVIKTIHGIFDKNEPITFNAFTQIGKGEEEIELTMTRRELLDLAVEG